MQLLHHDDRHQRRHSTTRAGWSDQPTLRSRNRVPQPSWPWWPSSGSAERRPAARSGASQLPRPQRAAAALAASERLQSCVQPSSLTGGGGGVERGREEGERRGESEGVCVGVVGGGWGGGGRSGGGE